MPMRLAVAVLLFVAVVTVSCGPTRVPCTASSCSGCCDSSTGLCASGTSPSQCGASGQTCRACLLGQSCLTGQCTDSNSGAGNAGGGFVAAGGAAAGGTAGGGLVGGGSAGGATTAGGAAGGSVIPASCPGTCTGCCDATGCHPGNVDRECGGGGQLCEPCRGAQRCEIFRFCRDSACAGCVDATGACVGGTTPAACGNSGLLCRQCRTGESCTNGFCVASSCAGCRLPNGSCYAGNELYRCGTGGATCTTCVTECRNFACVGASQPDAGAPDAGFLAADDAGFVRVGNVTPFTTDATQVAGIAYGFALPIPEPLTLTHLAVFGRSQTGRVRFGLYQDFFGTPTQLVASTAFSSLALGPVEVPVSAPVSVDAGTYWLLGVVDVDSPIGMGTSVTERLFTLGAAQPFPATFPTNGSQRFNSQRNFYVVGHR